MKETPLSAARLRRWEDPLEKGMATHSSIPAWEIPWTEEPGGLQSTGLQKQVFSWHGAWLSLVTMCKLAQGTLLWLKEMTWGHVWVHRPQFLCSAHRYSKLSGRMRLLRAETIIRSKPLKPC